MNESIGDRFRIGDETEAGEADQTDRPIPANVAVTRPNMARERVPQVRLDDDELAALERSATRRVLKPSTLARERLLSLIAEDTNTGDVAAQLNATAERRPRRTHR